MYFLVMKYAIPFMLEVDSLGIVLTDHDILFMIREKLVLFVDISTFYNHVSPC